MKTILKIARAELRLMFYSPIAWFLLIVFLIQCGLGYWRSIEGYAISQELGSYERLFLRDLTARTFVGMGGLFPSIMQNLYLYIPLLTMGLISREISSGTIKLLYSSPVKIRQIVFGKYLAMVGYSVLLLGVISIFAISGNFHIQNTDSGILSTAMLGFFLLICAYAAIGLFMSSLTSYQIVAAISTFVMMGLLTYIGNLWQEINFVRDLTYFLSLNGRAEKLLHGFITTKDVIYYLVIIAMFLGLTIYKLRHTTESKPLTIRIGRYAMVVAGALLLGYVSSRHALIGYLDFTRDKKWTLTPTVQKIVKDFGNEPLKITYYANILNGFSSMGMPVTRNINNDRWENYIRFKHDVDLDYVLYYDEPLDDPFRMKMNEGKTLKEAAERYVKGRNLDMNDIKSPEDIRKEIDLRPELNRFVMKLTWKDRTTFLRIFNDNMVWPSETEVGAAFKRLQQAKMPKILFVTGDLERDIYKAGDRDYKTLTNAKVFRYSLINQGFDVDTISLGTETIPSGISALVLADPRTELSAGAMDKLQQYIDNGGNLLVAAEPKRRDLQNKVLSRLGVSLIDGQIVQQDKDYTPDIVSTYLTKPGAGISHMLADALKDSNRVFMPGVAGISFVSQNWTVTPMLMTNNKTSWNKAKPLDAEMYNTADASLNTPIVLVRNVSNNDEEQKPVPALGTLTFASPDGDQRGSFPTAVNLVRKVNGKEQRIVITGDADFMSQKEIIRGNSANFTMSTAIFSWLSYGEFPINTSRPAPIDNGVDMSSSTAKALKIVYVWILPALLLAAGAVLLMRRARR